MITAVQRRCIWVVARKQTEEWKIRRQKITERRGAAVQRLCSCSRSLASLSSVFWQRPAVCDLFLVRYTALNVSENAENVDLTPCFG